ncbi:hypothetical protein CEXT_109951 [Caerostris extrusa]|uniref:Uncharacterized protein n=1 Tax=Caerostris extrusa TaxID=172846 RepID=A0AAV4XDT1_CAEEX|nr:hypothetical protein CEXT_109951 [Caerostris extrusa]
MLNKDFASRKLDVAFPTIHNWSRIKTLNRKNFPDGMLQVDLPNNSQLVKTQNVVLPCNMKDFVYRKLHVVLNHNIQLVKIQNI